MKNFALLIILVFMGCKAGIKYEIGASINNNDVFEKFKRIVAKDDYYRPGGETNIVVESREIKKNILWHDTLGVLSIWAFKDKHISYLYITPLSSSFLKFSIQNNQFQTSIFYHDDINSFGKGVFVKPEKALLKFKNKTFNLGDTIYGFIDLETDTYIRSKIEYKDKYKGYFACIIVPKDTFLKYQWLR
jgi:hypothetical protein